MTTDPLPSPRTVRVMQRLTPGEATALEVFHAARHTHRTALRGGELTWPQFLARWSHALDALAGAANGSPVFDVIIRNEHACYYQARRDLNRRTAQTSQKHQDTYREDRTA